MAIFKVSRTDRVFFEECDEAIVRAHNPTEALQVVLTSDSGTPEYGFLPDGSNATVERVATTGKSGVISASYCPGF